MKFYQNKRLKKKFITSSLLHLIIALFYLTQIDDFTSAFFIIWICLFITHAILFISKLRSSDRTVGLELNDEGITDSTFGTVQWKNLLNIKKELGHMNIYLILFFKENSTNKKRRINLSYLEEDESKVFQLVKAQFNIAKQHAIQSN